MNHSIINRLNFCLLALLLVIPAGNAASQLSAQSNIRMESSAVTAVPVLDGQDKDPAWRSARSYRLAVREAEDNSVSETTDVLIKSVHTSTHIYFLVSWLDATHDATHKTWVWNSAEKSYEEGEDREDVVALSFEHTGEFNADMLSGVEAVWDVWQWKAARTDPGGYAMDKTHHYTRARPEGKATSFDAKDGTTTWISRPEDAGVSAEKKQPAPKDFTGERVPQYVRGEPKGSAADIQAKGAWNNGRWTVEFARKLSTGYEDDAVFLPGKTIRMSVAVFDKEEHIHHSVAKVIELTF